MLNISMETQGLMLPILVLLVILTSATWAQNGGLPVEAVSWYLRPDNPLSKPLIAALSLSVDNNHLHTIFSTSDSCDGDVVKALQYFASMNSDAEMYAGCASAIKDIDRFDRVRYVDGEWRDRLASLDKPVDLLHFSIPTRKADSDLATWTSSFNEAVKRVKMDGGVVMVEGCADNDMTCRVMQHFAEMNGFVVVEKTEGGFVLKKKNTTTSSMSSVPNISTSPNTNSREQQQLHTDTINQLLQRQDNRGLFMNAMSTGDKRYAGWLKVANIVKARKLRHFWQTGPMRPNSDDGDDHGRGTVVLARLAKMVGGRLTIVDSDPFDYAQAMTADVKDHVRFVRDLSVSFLSRLAEPVDLMYLNSLDFDHQDEGPCQQYRWAEVNLSNRQFGKGVVIVLDHCDLPFEGPCKMATRFLMNDLRMKMVQEGPLRIFSASMDPVDLSHDNSSPPAPLVAPPASEQPTQNHVDHQNQIQQQPQSIQFTPNKDIEDLFVGLMDHKGHRYVTFRMVAELAVKRQARVFVETGTARNGRANCGGDGCSTVILGRLARLLKGRLHTVDISPENMDGSREGTRDLSDYIDYHVSDSVRFLRDFDEKKIDVLYLDSYDYDGIEYGPSQQHHLKELQAAWDKVHDGTIIFLDDCALSYEGKCKMASQFLAEKGWRLVVDAYQRVYTKD